MPVPLNYTLWQLGQRMSIPPWVLEGFPIDQPPVEWIIRCLEYARMEASTKVERG